MQEPRPNLHGHAQVESFVHKPRAMDSYPQNLIFCTHSGLTFTYMETASRQKALGTAQLPGDPDNTMLVSRARCHHAQEEPGGPPHWLVDPDGKMQCGLRASSNRRNTKLGIDVIDLFMRTAYSSDAYAYAFLQGSSRLQAMSAHAISTGGQQLPV